MMVRLRIVTVMVIIIKIIVIIVKVIEIKYKKEATILNNLFIMNALC
jgi:hypothetical protein